MMSETYQCQAYLPDTYSHHSAPSESQLMNWIKRRNMKRNAAQEETTPLNALPLKKRKLWNHHQKRFAKTEAGKEALSLNPGQFNRVASKAFRDINEEERMELEAQLLEPSRMTKGEVNKRAAAIFRKIQKSFDELDELKYMGFAIAFYENKMQITGTSATVSCFSPSVVEYLHALIRAANAPPLPSPQCSCSCGNATKSKSSHVVTPTELSTSHTVSSKDTTRASKTKLKRAESTQKSLKSPPSASVTIQKKPASKSVYVTSCSSMNNYQPSTTTTKQVTASDKTGPQPPTPTTKLVTATILSSKNNPQPSTAKQVTTTTFSNKTDHHPSTATDKPVNATIVWSGPCALRFHDRSICNEIPSD